MLLSTWKCWIEIMMCLDELISKICSELSDVFFNELQSSGWDKSVNARPHIQITNSLIKFIKSSVNLKMKQGAKNSQMLTSMLELIKTLRNDKSIKKSEIVDGVKRLKCCGNMKVLLSRKSLMIQLWIQQRPLIQLVYMVWQWGLQIYQHQWVTYTHIYYKEALRFLLH